MKIYILTDLEGVGGVVNRTYTKFGEAAYERAREWLTLEVNEVIEGALQGGATEILVLDGHGSNSACNMLYEKLDGRAQYIQGVPWTEYLQCLDDTFDGLFQVGVHAMAKTKGAVLEHTMSSDTWGEMTVNGKPMGEIGLAAAVAGHFDVPFVMVSGDDKAYAEAAQIVPDIEQAVVKLGISRGCARMYSMLRVHSLLREAAKNAMSKVKSIEPFKVESPVNIEIEYQKSESVEPIKERDGVRKLNSRRVLYTGKNIIEAFKRVQGG